MYVILLTHMTHQQVVMASPAKNDKKRVYMPAVSCFPKNMTIESAYAYSCEVLEKECKAKHGRVAHFYCPHRSGVHFTDIKDSTPPKSGRATTSPAGELSGSTCGVAGNIYKHTIPLALKIFAPTKKTSMLTVRIGVVVALEQQNESRVIAVPDTTTAAQEEYADFVRFTETLALIDVNFQELFWTENAATKVDCGKSLAYVVDMSGVVMKSDDETNVQLSGHIIIASTIDRENAMYWRVKIEANMLNKHVALSKRTFFPDNPYPDSMGYVKIEANASKERYKELRKDAEREVNEAKAAIQSAQDGEDAPDQSDVFLDPTVAYWKEKFRLEHAKFKTLEQAYMIAKEQDPRDAPHTAQNVDKAPENYKLTQLIRNLPSPLFHQAIVFGGGKQEFDRFYNKTVYINESHIATGAHDFNIYGIKQETSNIFCLLMSDVQRKEVIDVMVQAFENGEGSMRHSYKHLFQKFSRRVEYEHNRRHEDKKSKQVEINRKKWVDRLTKHFNDVVKQRFDTIELLPAGGADDAVAGAGGAADDAVAGAGGICTGAGWRSLARGSWLLVDSGGAAGGDAGGAADGATDGTAGADGTAGGDDGDKCACCGRVPPEACMRYD